MLRERDLHTASYALSLSFSKGRYQKFSHKTKCQCKRKSENYLTNTNNRHFCCDSWTLLLLWCNVSCREREPGPKSTITTIIVIEHEPSSFFGEGVTKNRQEYGEKIGLFLEVATTNTMEESSKEGSAKFTFSGPNFTSGLFVATLWSASPLNEKERSRGGRGDNGLSIVFFRDALIFRRGRGSVVRGGFWGPPQKVNVRPLKLARKLWAKRAVPPEVRQCCQWTQQVYGRGSLGVFWEEGERDLYLGLRFGPALVWFCWGMSVWCKVWEFWTFCENFLFIFFRFQIILLTLNKKNMAWFGNRKKWVFLIYLLFNLEINKYWNLFYLKNLFYLISFWKKTFMKTCGFTFIHHV